MYHFDVVLADDGEVLFNGTPRETHAWLGERVGKSEFINTRVICGYDLAVYTIDRYLAQT